MLAPSMPTTEDTSWFVHDRFGLFIHWGLYSLASRGEWAKYHARMTDADYQRYFDHFEPDLYDPTVWASEARDAGMKYAVVTSKHHDGFCLWDTALSDYRATNTPWGQDLLQPMVEAFRAQGLKIGFYHSLLDWHHPQYPLDELYPRHDNLAFRAREQGRDIALYRQYLHGQVRELLTRFGEVDILWFDFSYSERDYGWARGKGREEWGGDELTAMARALQPGIIINDRLDVGWSDVGDFFTPQQYQLPMRLTWDGEPVVWELCHPLRKTWGYVRDDLDWISVDMLVRLLVDTVSKGGNLLLNVGPTPRGEFDLHSIERLRGIGAWMRQHSRAIYGCTASAFTPPPDCRYTQNGQRLYLHLFAWPIGHVHLPGLANRVEYAQLLSDGSEIKTMVLDPEGPAERKAFVIMPDMPPNTLTLELPLQKPDAAVPVIELFLK